MPGFNTPRQPPKGMILKAGFSSALAQRLHWSQAKFDAFIDSTVYSAEQACDDNTELVREQQLEIDNLLRLLNQVSDKRGVAKSQNAPAAIIGGVAAQRNKIEETQSQLNSPRIERTIWASSWKSTMSSIV